MHYIRSIKRPFTEANKFMAGSALFMIPFMNIITGLFGYGYILKAVREATNKDFKLPEFTHPHVMFLEGIILSVVWMIYFFPAILLAFISIMGLLWAFLTSYSTYYIIAGIGFILSGLLGITAAYLAPMAIVHYAKTEKFKELLNIKKILRICMNLIYFKAWIFSIVYAAIISSITLGFSVRSSYTIIGPYVLFGICTFIIGITTGTILGEAYGEIKEK